MGNGHNHPTALTAENQYQGLVLLPKAGEVASVLQRLSVVEETGLSHHLPPSSLLREITALKEEKENTRVIIT